MASSRSVRVFRGDDEVLDFRVPMNAKVMVGTHDDDVEVHVLGPTDADPKHLKKGSTTLKAEQDAPAFLDAQLQHTRSGRNSAVKSTLVEAGATATFQNQTDLGASVENTAETTDTKKKATAKAT